MTMTTALKPLDLLPIGSLDAYLHQINQFPLLTAEEEYNLAVRLQKKNDLAAAKALILPHLRYVARIAKNYMGYGISLSDLIQEGNIGLMKAVKRFNPDVGARLVTFAMHWIKAEIHEYILRNWRIVKVATTKAQRKLFFNLRQLKKHLGWMSHQEVQDIAKDLGVKAETVREMEMRLFTTDAPFESHPDDSEELHNIAPVNYLEDTRYNPAEQIETTEWTHHSHDAIYEALETLDERSQAIIRARWLDQNKLTLHDLANQYQISAERVRQLEKNAMVKLRRAMEAVV